MIFYIKIFDIETANLQQTAAHRIDMLSVVEACWPKIEIGLVVDVSCLPGTNSDIWKKSVRRGAQAGRSIEVYVLSGDSIRYRVLIFGLLA